MNTEITEKTERLQKMLAEQGLGGVLLNAQHNFAWLTAGGSNGVDLTREHGICSLLVRSDGKCFLLANNIERPRLLAEEVSADDFEPVEFAWEDEKTPNFVLEKARSLITGELATDLLLDPAIRSIEGQVAACRYALTEAEIERFGLLGRDAGTALGEVLVDLSPGETEIEVARKVTDALAAHGIYSVVSLIAADERIANFRHPIPTSKQWEKTLMIVVCARRYGLIASLTRIICSGDIPDELARKTEAAAKVNAHFYSATQPGASGAELYKIAEEAYASQGFRDEIHKHHQGGACGYRTRDWVAHPRSNEVVQPNQAFAWNPSITGTKVEETGIVTENGFELITATPGFPQIAVSVDGREYFSPGILSLSKGATA